MQLSSDTAEGADLEEQETVLASVATASSAFRSSRPAQAVTAADCRETLQVGHQAARKLIKSSKPNTPRGTDNLSRYDKSRQRNWRVRATRDTIGWSITAELGTADLADTMRDVLERKGRVWSTARPATLPPSVSDDAHWLTSLLASLGRSMIDDDAGLWAQAVMCRVQAAFFYRLYEAAKLEVARTKQHNTVSIFLRESEIMLQSQHEQCSSKPVRISKAATIVRDRLADTIFLDGRLDTPRSQ